MSVGWLRHSPASKPHAVVVDAEEGGVRMRNVDGNEGDVGGGDLVGDHGGDVLLDLELDDEVDGGADELFGVEQSGLGVVAIVEDEEVDAEGRRQLP